MINALVIENNREANKKKKKKVKRREKKLKIMAGFSFKSPFRPIYAVLYAAMSRPQMCN